MPLRSLALPVLRSINRVVAPLLDVGIGNPLPIGSGPIVVESTGRRTGVLRRTPLLSLRLGDTLAVSTVRSESDWFANLRAEPRARIRLFGRDRPVSSQLVEVPGLRIALLRLRGSGDAAASDPAEPS